MPRKATTMLSAPVIQQLDSANWKERLAAMEEEREKMNSELWGLRDRVQELEWQNGQLERKLGEKAETGGENGNDDGGERMKKIEERLERSEKELREVAERFERGRPETMMATTSGSGSNNASGSRAAVSQANACHAQSH